MVRRLPRRPGQKEVRYAHLLSGEPSSSASAAAVQEGAGTGDTVPRDRIAALEEEVGNIRQELQELQRAFADFTRQFE
jgi:uncharacterized protein YceH (UPF0502 family)